MALHRTDKYGDQRFYFDDETFKFYMSATTFCKRVLPENPYLTEWKQKLGVFEANRIAKISAHYGTVMHKVIERFLEAIGYTPAMVKADIEDYCQEHYLGEMEGWVKRINKDLLAFAQFAFDKKIDPVHTERWLKHDVNTTGGIAGTLDLECYLRFNGKRKEALIDLKSGMKGFYDSHVLQLELYKMIVGKEDLLIFNWAPKNWKVDKKPTYTFTNQTDGKMGQKLPNFIVNAIIDDLFKPSYAEIAFEQVTLGEEPVFEFKDLEQLMLGK